MFTNLYNDYTLKETVGFSRNELTRESFIKLSKIEAERDKIDIGDLFVRIINMGFNESLTIDQV